MISEVVCRASTGSYAATFTIINNCSFTVWPAIFSYAGTQLLPTTGFTLPPGDSNTVPMPDAWSGRLWGRTLCSHNITGKFSCVTGDCGSSTVECGGGNKKCPIELKVTKDVEGVVACQSSCEAHEACHSNLFSQFSKSICTDAHDHGSFTCAFAFCPASSER
ncbi:Thaumatin protein 1 [Spatholobus suberectus]|nr:Thaumatin protein 1 [Spatholobus suberectus]